MEWWRDEWLSDDYWEDDPDHIPYDNRSRIYGYNKYLNIEEELSKQYSSFKEGKLTRYGFLKELEKHTSTDLIELIKLVGYCETEASWEFIWHSHIRHKVLDKLYKDGYHLKHGGNENGC